MIKTKLRTRLYRIKKNISNNKKQFAIIPEVIILKIYKYLYFRLNNWKDTINTVNNNKLECFSKALKYNVLFLVTQWCLTLCDPMDYSLPGSSVHGDSPGKDTGVGCHALLQGIFQLRDGTQVSCIAGRFFTI